MSKFIEHIEAKLRDERVMPMWPNKLEVSRASDPVDHITWDPMSTYKIEVAWRTHVTCYPKDIQKLLGNVVRELKEAVYGDIKERLIRLERAIYEHDVQAAQMEIRDIMREVFGA